MATAINNSAPSGAAQAVLKPSDAVPEDAQPVSGIEFDKHAQNDITAAELVEGMANMGFQASSVGQASRIIDGMVSLSCQLFPDFGADSVSRGHGVIQRRDRELPSFWAIPRI